MWKFTEQAPSAQLIDACTEEPQSIDSIRYSFEDRNIFRIFDEDGDEFEYEQKFTDIKGFPLHS